MSERAVRGSMFEARLRGGSARQGASIIASNVTCPGVVCAVRCPVYTPARRRQTISDGADFINKPGETMQRASIGAAILAWGLCASAQADQTLLLKQPDISDQHLGFVYAGDIWIADRDGSNPRRLTSHPAEENQPSFSPDGSMVAFAAQYENNTDVYVVPVSGGTPTRLTYHPRDDVPTGWTADGAAVTFVSAREVDHGRSNQWYHVSVQGGLPEKRMEAAVFRGVYDETDKKLAYMSFGSGYNGLFGGTSGWKGYRGGTTPAIRIMDLELNTVRDVPGAGATNFNPMWLGADLFFVSDRDANKLFNIYRYEEQSGAIDKVSDEQDWEVRAAAAHGTSLVYEAGGRLMEIDLPSGVTREIEVTLATDLPQRRIQWKDAADTIDSADLSPSGKRAILTARGDVFTVATDEGPTRNVSATGDVREYSGVWSPDGAQIAFLRWTLDGQVLRVVDQLGREGVRDYALGPHFYEILDWTRGDQPRIVYSDNHLGLYAIELVSGDTVEIARGERRDEIEASASPDGRWLAYTREGASYHRDLYLYDFDGRRSIRVSDGAADVAAPAFSADGKHLFFAASTNSGPLQVGLNMSSQERPYRAGLYALVLSQDDASPLLGDSGDEAAEEDAAENGDEGSDENVVVSIDIDSLRDRIVALPVAERNYGSLAAAKDGGLYYVQYGQPGVSNEVPGSGPDTSNSLWRFDFDDKEASEIQAGVNDFALSGDGTHLLVAKSDGSLAVGEAGADPDLEPLDLSGVRVRIDPAEEWRLIFDEAWRMEQDYFYDPGMHGLDWQAVYDRYRPLVEHVGRREDLTTLIVEMIAEMQVGHNRSGGGDIHRERGTNTGLLGANFVTENGRHRIARVYTGESWNPFVKAPLATPGNNANEGEYILAVDGRELTADDNIFEYLQGTVGKQIALTVGPRADGRDAREILIEPVDSEGILRLWRWVEANRRAVDEATDGQVGYVYLPNTAGAGYTFFNRMFFAQLDKQGMIIDERSNGGGQAANYITDVLSRRHLSGWKDRDGLVFDTPAGAMHGPKVMLIDQDAGSGGDFLPYSFRQLGIGQLIGTRTWGGLIGIAANPTLVDGGFLTVPFFRFFDADGDWSIENEGVSPDIVVPLDPIAVNSGRDVQLERAIEQVQTELATRRNTLPSTAPSFPTELGQ